MNACVKHSRDSISWLVVCAAKTVAHPHARAVIGNLATHFGGSPSMGQAAMNNHAVYRRTLQICNTYPKEDNMSELTIHQNWQF
ncbi:hypothetical protein [Burkholderia singularis]|uniref:hypothetical protein n=1 Tax=Burkholderia singularis TaxID=1503053 RepID=UPI00117F95C6|nr:hypothetical protein [Burkholderia singularis]